MTRLFSVLTPGHELAYINPDAVVRVRPADWGGAPGSKTLIELNGGLRQYCLEDTGHVYELVIK